MSIKPTFISVDCTLSTISLRACSHRARLPIAIAGLLLSAHAQAFLPTPLSLVTTGELAPDINSAPQVKAVSLAANTTHIGQ